MEELGVTANRCTVFAVLAILVSALTACGSEDPPSEAAPPVEGEVHPQLATHSTEFEKRVYQVTDGVHQAVGFGLANSIMVEGDECVVIVDAMGNVESAREVRAAFQEISPKPIGALIYTHNHADHVFGGRGFVPVGEVDVYAHSWTEYYIDRMVSIVRPVISRRSAHMFGGQLPLDGPDAMVNCGIGPYLEIGRGESTFGLIRPNHSFDNLLEVELCGVDFVMIHAPGETNDQIFVWLPEKKTLLPGDNVYKAFPNLYTIRGTLYRDVLEWSRSIDKMRLLRPEHMVPSHTRPLSGADRIEEILTAYRDAIQFVHDQTVRGINNGLTPDELVKVVKLPPHLRDHPYLQEFYGTVEWSVRSIFTGYLGWFDGDTATLSPVSPEERARGLVELAGGQPQLLAAAEKALQDQRHRWAAELAGQLLHLDPDMEQAKRLKAAALRALGQRSISSNGRNYYLTQARELESLVEPEIGMQLNEDVRSLVNSIPIGNFMASMPVRLDPEKSADIDMLVGFHFPDVDESYTIHVRRGVAEFQRSFPEEPNVAISVDSEVWREIVVGFRNPAIAFASGDVQVQGSTLDLIAFLRLFG
jgi:alkyl sulfatase BDS1-like metallo-beta-lactamase superfamily hydrolase